LILAGDVSIKAKKDGFHQLSFLKPDIDFTGGQMGLDFDPTEAEKD